MHREADSDNNIAREVEFESGDDGGWWRQWWWSCGDIWNICDAARLFTIYIRATWRNIVTIYFRLPALQSNTIQIHCYIWRNRAISLFKIKSQHLFKSVVEVPLMSTWWMVWWCACWKPWLFHLLQYKWSAKCERNVLFTAVPICRQGTIVDYESALHDDQCENVAE